jgi:hypothetical protein
VGGGVTGSSWSGDAGSCECKICGLHPSSQASGHPGTHTGSGYLGLAQHKIGPRAQAWSDTKFRGARRAHARPEWTTIDEVKDRVRVRGLELLGFVSIVGWGSEGSLMAEASCGAAGGLTTCGLGTVTGTMTTFLL